MTITITAPTFYQSLDKVKYLAKSAERNNVPIWWYGLGKPYHGWHDIQIVQLLEELHKIPTSHVLYTDASDVIMLSGLDEIEGKYAAMGCPQLLMSVESDGGVCAGGWMGDRLKMIEALEFLRTFRPKVEDSDNPQVRWRCAVVQGWLEPTVDYMRKIFQVADEVVEVRTGAGGRVYNPRTSNWPCIFHFAGGYTDPEIGKSTLIEPLWKQLGYE